MTTAIATPGAAGVLTAGSERALGAGHGRLRAAWNRYVAYHASIAELRALSDRQLADIGIARGDIRRHVGGAIYRD